MSKHKDRDRFISLSEAIERLGIRHVEARDYLLRSGIVRDICGRKKVWLPDLSKLGQDEEKAVQKKRPRASARRSIEERERALGL